MIEGIRKKKLTAGVMLVLLGIALPTFLNIDTFRINDTLSYAVSNHDRLYLIVGGITLVLLNSLRAFPHYIGAFFISESIKIKPEYSLSKYIKVLIILLIIPFVYFFIWIAYENITYHFGVPSVTMIILIILIGDRDYNYVSEWKKVALIIFFISAFQFMDIMPIFKKLPIGKGEVSLQVKLISQYLTVENELNVISLFFMSLFSIFGTLVFLLIRDENKMRVLEQLKKENLMLENERVLQNIENRTFREVKNLVHDLKSPLTSAQALVSLVRHSLKNKNMDKESDYLNRVENSIDSMSNMISEILNEDVRFQITTEDLIRLTLANISKSTVGAKIEYLNKVPESLIETNKITFTRALVNVIENAKDAIKNVKEGKIEIIVDRISVEDEDFIEISIIDNGVGIEEENIEKVWESGFSTYDSYGLGLSFIKRTVEKSDGAVFLHSNKNVGTTVTILLREV